MEDIRLWFSLFMKELRQIRRNRRLIVMLIIPPTINIILFGFALNPTVKGLKLGVMDESRSAESRELISALTESLAFKVTRNYTSHSKISKDVGAGNLNAALIIPADFAKQRARGETAKVQFIVDGVDSNTATIASSYASRIVESLNENILARRAQGRAAIAVDNVPAPKPRPQVEPKVALLYNSGLQTSWFIVTGLIGALLVLQGSIVSAASMVREKEVGTIEQLLMTPAESGQIITAKIAPILLLLTFDIVLSLTVARLVFGVPVRGSFLIFFFAGALCVFSGIGIGTLIATFTKSQQQAQLMSFFVNPPLVLLSGATTPIEAMPSWLQPITLLNPVRHFATISRGILLKGVGFEILLPNLAALVGFCVVLVGVSAWQFRKQLR